MLVLEPKQRGSMKEAHLLGKGVGSRGWLMMVIDVVVFLRDRKIVCNTWT